MEEKLDLLVKGISAASLGSFKPDQGKGNSRRHGKEKNRKEIIRSMPELPRMLITA